jgi:PleD family two-component response regulator
MGLQTTPHLSDKPARAAGAPACLVVLYGGELGRSTDLPQQEVTIGRDDDNPIPVAGDRVLQGMAGIVMKHVRRNELLPRYGGDEFAVVLPETTIESATLFAERIRAELESATLDYDEEPLQIAISLGATALEPTDTLEALVARADANQYEAKESGQNGVVGGRREAGRAQ